MSDRSEDRHLTLIPGRYRMGKGVAHAVTITNLSERGCRFHDRFGRLTPGAFLTVKIGPVGPIEGNVVWHCDHMAGVEFRDKLHPSVLDHIRAHIDEQKEAG